MSVHLAIPALFAFGTGPDGTSAEPWDAAPASVEAVEPTPPTYRELFRAARRPSPRPPQYGMAEATRVLYQVGLSDDPPESEPTR